MLWPDHGSEYLLKSIISTSAILHYIFLKNPNNRLESICNVETLFFLGFYKTFLTGIYTLDSRVWNGNVSPNSRPRVHSNLNV